MRILKGDVYNLRGSLAKRPNASRICRLNFRGFLTASGLTACARSLLFATFKKGYPCGAWRCGTDFRRGKWRESRQTAVCLESNFSWFFSIYYRFWAQRSKPFLFDFQRVMEKEKKNLKKVRKKFGSLYATAVSLTH